MEPIALPGKINFKPGKNKNEGIIIIEPCYPGYGITLGNSLRRVLLSSLPGAAVIGVKIEGADHEFTSLANVKEDILEIVLNIKKLRMKIHSDEIEKLELEAHGDKKIKAGDIKKNSSVEIANPELDIAEITDIGGNLKFTIYASKGRGYETIENRELKQKEIGYIELDSIFSPVISVSVDIENVRVGKMTNWDKLNLNIATDGTIGPEEAFKQSVKILIDQLYVIIGGDKSKNIDKEKENKEKSEKSEAEEESAVEDKVEDKVDEQKGESEDEKKEIPKRKRGRPRKDENQ